MITVAMSHCPTCGAELNGRSICPSCGTLAGIEMQIGRARQNVRQFFGRTLHASPRRFTQDQFLWACALVPLFILPPLVSLIYGLGALRSRDPKQQSNNVEWLAVIAAVNIVLSILLLYKFHFAPSDIATFFVDAVTSFFQFLRQRFQPGAPPTILTPI